jgi:hypothetical protein
MPGHASAPPPRDCQTAFQKVATDCVHLIERNRRSAIAADPEAIHAMRVELTRLRAAVRELRWLNSALGNARDRDVTANYTRRKRYRGWAKDGRIGERRDSWGSILARTRRECGLERHQVPDGSKSDAS